MHPCLGRGICWLCPSELWGGSNELRGGVNHELLCGGVSTTTGYGTECDIASFVPRPRPSPGRTDHIAPAHPSHRTIAGSGVRQVHLQRHRGRTNFRTTRKKKGNDWGCVGGGSGGESGEGEQNFLGGVEGADGGNIGADGGVEEGSLVESSGAGCYPAHPSHRAAVFDDQHDRLKIDCRRCDLQEMWKNRLFDAGTCG